MATLAATGVSGRSVSRNAKARLPHLDQGGRDDGHFGMGEPATRSFRLPRLQTARRDQPARAVGANRHSKVERSSFGPGIA